MNQASLAQRLLGHSGSVIHPRIRDGLLVVAGSLLMALCSRISFPLPTTPVPITMQTFGILLTGALLGPRLGALAMIVYLLEGLAGLPVFAFGRNAWSPDKMTGLPAIIGSTAGYLYAAPLAAAVVGTLAMRGWDRRIIPAMIAMLLGNLVILLFGFLWLAMTTWLVTHTLNISTLLMLSVLPFIPGDILKIILAALALPGGWALLRLLDKNQESVQKS